VRACSILAAALLAGVLIEPSQGRQKREGTQEQQSDFSMELEIAPIRKPLKLPTSALLPLSKDASVSSCTADENLPNGRALLSWFVASEIDLGKSGQPDLIVLPAEMSAPAPTGPASNACFFGPYTTTFWVLRKTGGSYDVILRVNAHDLEVRWTRHNGLRDIEASVSNMRGSGTTIYRFNGQKYVKYKATIRPPER